MSSTIPTDPSSPVYDCVCRAKGAHVCPAHPRRENPLKEFGTAKSRRRLQKIIERDGPLCHYCGIDLARPDVLANVDHKVAASRGGNSDLANFVASCYVCNHAKGSMTEEVFRERLANGELDAAIARAQNDVRLRLERMEHERIYQRSNSRWA